MLEALADVSMDMREVVEHEDFTVYRMVQTKNRFAEPADTIVLVTHSDELGYSVEKVCETEDFLSAGKVDLTAKGRYIGTLEVTPPE